MGYYTAYEISFEGKEERINLFKEDLLKATTYADGTCDSDVVDLLTYGGVCAKLYDLCDAIEELAPKYADILIRLEGQGDERGDWWETRWKGDLSESHIAKMPPFKNYKLLTESEKQK